MSRPASDSESEADDLESLIHSLSIRVEYYRSFEYCLKWEESMYTTRSSRIKKASKKSSQRSPSPNEEDIQRKLRGKKRQKKTEAGDGAVNTIKLSNRDLIDIINDTNDAKSLAEEVEGKSVEVADKAVDESDEDSVSSSIASGPSTFCPTNLKRWSSLQSLCSACQKLYQRAEKMKTPIKDKLLDNDPNSLTCDHWVLIKQWRPRRLPNARGKLLTHVKLVKKRLNSGVKRSEMYETESSACSRPHTFLQRNLRCCVRVPAKKGRKSKIRRKRARGDSQGSRAAKQRRLHSNSPRQHLSRSCTRGSSPQPTSSLSSSPAFERCDDRKGDNQADKHTTVEVTPCTVHLETLKMKDLPPEKKTPKKSGFGKLLSQLRGNSSMIVREKC
ncbi:uncharacterized protein si:ch211-227n13.3 isoform X1 [Hippoglossus stenolepis]|uniref:uncharacterized protein si:ch211-227n13.3 isoform X1 n=2 Tax=Hippoglossus stenolepis TaxID=195615 RepID=UPI00159C9D84|nr:uncharacterized protein si:ch211-227n13.3 isoform X1 [Hippoglossus stenolepis]XP_035027404.1 uncharacterized protein si:ch211-227n13.3 isoform X1 [Hippoglossus stenolepis]